MFNCLLTGYMWRIYQKMWQRVELPQHFLAVYTYTCSRQRRRDRCKYSWLICDWMEINLYLSCSSFSKKKWNCFRKCYVIVVWYTRNIYKVFSWGGNVLLATVLPQFTVQVFISSITGFYLLVVLTLMSVIAEMEL